MNKVFQYTTFNIPKLEELTEFLDQLYMEYEQKRGVRKVLAWAIRRKALPLTIMRRPHQLLFTTTNIRSSVQGILSWDT